jgi:serine/threonine protein kinase
VKPQKAEIKLEESSELPESEKLLVAKEGPSVAAPSSLPGQLAETDVDLVARSSPPAAHDESMIFASPDQAVDAMLAREDKNIGKILGGMYRIESKLGAGGMSVVYKAEHLLLQQPVVIKFIAHEHFNDFKMVRRFSQEAKASSILSHPNVVGTREFGVTEDGRPFIVMDYVPGIPLSDLIEQRGPLTPERAIELILPVCEGLKHAHERGIVHRDIKPANIIIENEGGEKETAKIVDFGIAKDTSVQAADKLTQTGEVFGSPSYMSPEQCAGKSVDPRSDVYSLGCVLVELLTGHPPFEGKNPLETLVMHMTADAPEFPNLPPELESVILKSLERDLTKRYQSIAEMESALESANLGSGVRTKRRKKRAKFFTRTRIIVYSSIAVISVLVAIIAGARAAYNNNQWRNTMGEAEQAALQGNRVIMEQRFKIALAEAKNS